MAGSPPLGKMSTDIRSSARTAQSAMAIRATTTVIGLVRAARTTRIFSDSSLAGLGNERLNVPGCCGDTEQPAPDAETRECIIDFCLGQQPLGVGHLVDRSQARFISRGRLLCRSSCGRDLDRCIGRNPPASL